MRASASSRPSLRDGLLAVLVAPRCLACGDPLLAPRLGPVCPACWASVRPLPPPLCPTCGDPLPSWRVVTLDSGACPACRRRPPVDRAEPRGRRLRGDAGRLVHALKYEKRLGLARRLAALMRDRAPEVLAGADAVVPVPLHWRRHYARGFNQAHGIARHLGAPVCPALRRVRSTPPQVGQLPRERRRNVTGAFALSRRRRFIRPAAGWPPRCAAGAWCWWTT